MDVIIDSEKFIKTYYNFCFHGVHVSDNLINRLGSDQPSMLFKIGCLS
jgi:hypothetical protein